MTAQPVARMSSADYLAWEREQTERHEYYDGDIFLMAGGTRNHALLAANMIASLHAALADQRCRVFGSDLKLYVPAFRLFTYPDISVVCEEEQFYDEDQEALLNPQLIIEVLSPSTESYDRGQKFRFYRSINSLSEYVLIAQDRVGIEVFRKDEAGRWVLHEADRPDGPVELATVGSTLEPAKIYDGVTLDENRNIPH